MSALPPPPRETGTAYRVGLVCLGNICRSPVADTVLSDAVQQAGLAGRVQVASCGTGGWHVGEPMDRRAAQTLRDAGYDPSRHRARQLDADWLGWDLLLAMDEQNLEDVRALAHDVDEPVDARRVRLFRDFDPAGAGPVPDPYYGGPRGFADVLETVERTCAALVTGLAQVLPAP